jgi:hypothetical protein
VGPSREGRRKGRKRWRRIQSGRREERKFQQTRSGRSVL